MKKEPTVFIYGLIDPRTLELRYIGKSIDPEKRLKGHIKESKGTRRNNHNYNWVRQLLAEGLTPLLEVLEEVPEKDWREIEQSWISAAKAIGLNLTNTTDGGEGVSSYTNRGKKLSKKHRENLSKAHKGRKFTEEHRKNMSKNRKGKGLGNQNALGLKHTEETKKRISQTLKNGSHVAPWTGKHLSEEHKKKLREANKGRIKPEEECRNISKGLKGKRKSKEHREKLSKSKKAYFQNKANREKQGKASKLAWARKKAREKGESKYVQLSFISLLFH